MIFAGRFDDAVTLPQPAAQIEPATNYSDSLLKEDFEYDLALVQRLP